MKISASVSFSTRPTPAVMDAIRKNIPMINIMGIRRMPNISLNITSDTDYLGVSIININHPSQSKDMHDHRVTLITVPLCPKCRIMKKRIQKIQETHPEVQLVEQGLQTYINEAMKKKLMDAPIILINEKTFTGVVDERTILSALEL